MVCTLCRSLTLPVGGRDLNFSSFELYSEAILGSSSCRSLVVFKLIPLVLFLKMCYNGTMANTKRKKTSKNTKRRTTRSAKEVKPEHELPGGFWRQTCAVLMIALALFFVITWFGHGGSALNAVHDTVSKGIGLATYFIPVLLVYLAVKIFRAEDNRVATPVYIASFLMIFWISGVAAIWQNGGYVGGKTIGRGA